MAYKRDTTPFLISEMEKWSLIMLNYLATMTYIYTENRLVWVCSFDYTKGGFMNIQHQNCIIWQNFIYWWRNIYGKYESDIKVRILDSRVNRNFPQNIEEKDFLEGIIWLNNSRCLRKIIGCTLESLLVVLLTYKTFVEH